MFDLVRRYNQRIVVPIQIKHVHSSVSYQWAIYHKYHWCGHESPIGYGALVASIHYPGAVLIGWVIFITFMSFSFFIAKIHQEIGSLSLYMTCRMGKLTFVQPYFYDYCLYVFKFNIQVTLLLQREITKTRFHKYGSLHDLCT